MTTFDDKEKAAENKYAHDQETAFRIHARAHKLFGEWAAAKLGLSGAEALEYAQSAATVDLGKKGDESLLIRIHGDLAAKGINLSDHALRTELHHFHQLAREQIQGN